VERNNGVSAFVHNGLSEKRDDVISIYACELRAIICVTGNAFCAGYAEDHPRLCNDKKTIIKTLTSCPRFLELRLCNNKAELDDIIGSGDPIEVIENILKKYLKTHTIKTPSLWIEHSPRNFRFFHVLRHYFPDAKFIHIIRDGRAAYNSVKKPKWGPVDVINGARWWSQNVGECLVLENLFPRDIMRVRFEDLVTNPQKTLKEVCSFVDFIYSEEMILGQGLIKPSYSKHHKLVGKPPDRSAVDKWRRELSRKEINYFNYKNARLLKKLGYLESNDVKNPFGKITESLIRRVGKYVQRRNGKKFKKQLLGSIADSTLKYSGQGSAPVQE
jgi:hypothetical protein